MNIPKRQENGSEYRKFDNQLQKDYSDLIDQVFEAIYNPFEGITDQKGDKFGDNYLRVYSTLYPSLISRDLRKISNAIETLFLDNLDHVFEKRGYRWDETSCRDLIPPKGWLEDLTHPSIENLELALEELKECIGEIGNRQRNDSPTIASLAMDAIKHWLNPHTVVLTIAKQHFKFKDYQKYCVEFDQRYEIFDEAVDGVMDAFTKECSSLWDNVFDKVSARKSKP